MTYISRENIVDFTQGLDKQSPSSAPESTKLPVFDDVTVRTFSIGSQNKTENFRAFIGQSSQIEEEWRERLLEQGLLSTASSNRYL